MPNRSGNTLGKEGRRLRLWLRPETWAALEKAASELPWDSRVATAVERALEQWRVSQLDWAKQHTIAQTLDQLAAAVKAAQ